jgi:hypothetical protein
MGVFRQRRRNFLLVCYHLRYGRVISLFGKTIAEGKQSVVFVHGLTAVHLMSSFKCLSDAFDKRPGVKKCVETKRLL